MITPAVIHILDIKSKETKAQVKKGINIFFVVLLIIILLFVTKKVIKKLTKPDDETSNAEDNTDNSNLTYDSSIYDDFVATLKDAMLTWAFTDEDALFSVLNQLKNRDDWLKTFSVFGLISESGFGKGDNLTAWILSELSGADLAKARAILKKINVNI